MIKFLFEDKVDTPSSILLRASYNGNNILFAAGGNATNMFKSIQDYKSEYENGTLVVFFDLPPNNEKACKNYDSLIEAVLQSNYENVYIVPIICIEYYILRFLIRNKYLVVDDKNIDLINNLIISFNYSDDSVSKFINLSDYRLSSLEHIYKDLLKFLASKSKCMLNYTKHDRKGNIIADSYHGRFYRCDCDCDRKFCRSNCSSNLKEKAERLYTELPIFDILDDAHKEFLESLGINTTDKDFRRLFDELLLFFDNICKSMSINKPLILRYD